MLPDLVPGPSSRRRTGARARSEPACARSPPPARFAPRTAPPRPPSKVVAVHARPPEPSRPVDPLEDTCEKGGCHGRPRRDPCPSDVGQQPGRGDPQGPESLSADARGNAGGARAAGDQLRHLDRRRRGLPPAERRRPRHASHALAHDRLRRAGDGAGLRVHQVQRLHRPVLLRGDRRPRAAQLLAVVLGGRRDPDVGLAGLDGRRRRRRRALHRDLDAEGAPGLGPAAELHLVGHRAPRRAGRLLLLGPHLRVHVEVLHGDHVREHPPGAGRHAAGGQASPLLAGPAGLPRRDVPARRATRPDGSRGPSRWRSSTSRAGASCG